MIKYTLALIFCVLTITSFCMEEKNITWINDSTIGKVELAELTGYAHKEKNDSRITCYVRFLNKQSEEDEYRTLVSFNGGFIDIQDWKIVSEMRYKKLESQYEEQIKKLWQKKLVSKL